MTRRCRATIDPAAPNLLMDDLQLGLRSKGQVEPSFYLSLYAIPWSREIGTGHVALVRQRTADGAVTDRVLTDNPSLARALQAQLRAVGYSRVDLTGEPQPASFVRSPLKEQDHVRYLVAAVGLEIEARWDDLGEPMFALGPAPSGPRPADLVDALRGRRAVGGSERHRRDRPRLSAGELDPVAGPAARLGRTSRGARSLSIDLPLPPRSTRFRRGQQGRFGYVSRADSSSVNGRRLGSRSRPTVG